MPTFEEGSFDPQEFRMGIFGIMLVATRKAGCKQNGCRRVKLMDTLAQIAGHKTRLVQIDVARGGPSSCPMEICLCIEGAKAGASVCVYIAGAYCPTLLCILKYRSPVRMVA